MAAFCGFTLRQTQGHTYLPKSFFFLHANLLPYELLILWSPCFWHFGLTQIFQVPSVTSMETPWCRLGSLISPCDSRGSLQIISSSLWTWRGKWEVKKLNLKCPRNNINFESQWVVVEWHTFSLSLNFPELQFPHLKSGGGTCLLRDVASFKLNDM